MSLEKCCEDLSWKFIYFILDNVVNNTFAETEFLTLLRARGLPSEVDYGELDLSSSRCAYAMLLTAKTFDPSDFLSLLQDLKDKKIGSKHTLQNLEAEIVVIFKDILRYFERQIRDILEQHNGKNSHSPKMQ